MLKILIYVKNCQKNSEISKKYSIQIFLQTGYNSAVKSESDKIDYADFMTIAANGDMDQLIDKFSENSLYAKAKSTNFKVNPFHHMKPHEIEAYTRAREHCRSVAKFKKFFKFSNNSLFQKFNGKTHTRSFRFDSFTQHMDGLHYNE